MLGRLTLFALFCTLSLVPAMAQINCETAVLVPFPLTDTSPFSVPVSATFTAACNPIPNPGPAVDLDGGSPCTIGVCSQEVWFYTDPNETVQQNLHFQITTNFNGRIKWVLLYSESVDASTSAFPHCYWTNNFSTNLTQRGSGCADALTGVTIDFLPEGLDGSGYYFLLIQRETGTGGDVSVSMRKQVGTPTITAPSNDRCSTADVMQTSGMGGVGVDNLYASGGSGTWTDAITGTTKGATKQRQIVAEGGGGFNEDTYEFTTLFGDVYSNNTIDDATNAFFGVTEGCISNLDNSIYYTVTPPATDNWYLHVGDLACSWGPDSIQLLITTAGGLDCNNASLTTLLAGNGCNKVGATGTFPSADLTIGPLALNGGSTYGIIVDGKQAAQCDFQMLLTTSPTINAVLPFQFSFAQAESVNGLATLRWALASEDQLSHFEIERSEDGIHFDSFGERLAAAAMSEYQWTDPQRLIGTYYYRIAAIDLNGQQTYSERLRINLATSDLEILSLRYQQEEIQLHYTHHSTSPLRWELIDLNGRRVSMGDLDPLRGTSVHQIRVGALIPAVYVLRLYDEKQSLSRKFLVE